MIREYAFDPCIAVHDQNTLLRFISEFGASKGRVIGEVPKKWKEDLVRKIQRMGLSPVARRKILDEISKLAKTSVVPRDNRALNNEEWIARAKSLHEVEAFNGILTDSLCLEFCQYDYFDLLNNEPLNWEIEQTQSVNRNATELADSIDIALKLSKNVFFIDPYFDPLKESYRNPFLEFARRCTEGRVKSNKIYIHTCEINHENLSRRKTREDIRRGMEECVKPLMPSDLNIELWIWPFEKMHDRFILTNLVGFAFGHGLNEEQYQNSIDVNINRLGESERNRLYRLFSTEANRIGDSIFCLR